MASVYDALATYLARQPGRHCSLSIAEIERIVGRPLPLSARPPHPVWRNWWENSGSSRSRHSQSKFGWLAAGWEVDDFDWTNEIVFFRREAARGYWNRT